MINPCRIIIFMPEIWEIIEGINEKIQRNALGCFVLFQTELEIQQVMDELQQVRFEGTLQEQELYNLQIKNAQLELQYRLEN